MKNFSELKSDVATLVQRSGDESYQDDIGVWLQLSHKVLSEIYDFWTELQDVHNFSSVDEQENYPLPNRFDKPFRLYDLTNNKKISPITEEEYFDGHISNIADGDTGIPNEFRIYGTAGASVPIAITGDTLQVKSSSLSDGSVVVRIRGYIDSSFLIESYEDITISSVTPTTFVAGTTTFYKITHISKSANTTGYVTIANSTGTTLETLAPTDRIARHKVLKLGQIPNGAYSYRLLFKKTIVEMVDDNDYPFTDCSRYLITDATGWALAQDKENARADHYWKESAKALQVLLNNQQRKLGSSYVNKIVSVWLDSHRQ